MPTCSLVVAISYLTPAQKGLVHKVLSFKEGPFSLHGFDDEVEFNTQCSSQWDSLVHFHHQPSGTGYNGCKPTVEALEQPFGKADTAQDLPTLNHWHARGGLVGRGVLLDYRAYAEAKNISYSCFTDHRITIQVLEDVARHQGVRFKQGDILIVRTGFTEDLGAADAKQQEEMLGSHKAVGVEGTPAAAKWFWNKHFAAVAGDAIAFEALPPKKEDGSDAGVDGLGRFLFPLFFAFPFLFWADGILSPVLHQYFLSLFGLNIGELWDLKALAAKCKELGRYSFLLTSVPLNVPGGVGSPPNALAVF